MISQPAGDTHHSGGTPGSQVALGVGQFYYKVAQTHNEFNEHEKILCNFLRLVRFIRQIVCYN